MSVKRGQPHRARRERVVSAPRVTARFAGLEQRRILLGLTGGQLGLVGAGLLLLVGAGYTAGGTGLLVAAPVAATYFAIRSLAAGSVWPRMTAGAIAATTNSDVRIARCTREDSCCMSISSGMRAGEPAVDLGWRSTPRHGI